MRILIADDAPTSRHLLKLTLRKWGYDLTLAADGGQAFTALQGPEAPPLAILDWMMPELDGVEVCRRLRSLQCANPPYIILLTALNRKTHIVAGLEAGADDYLTKPFDASELLARVQVGQRMVELRQALAHRVKELEEALARVNVLQGLLPICAYCKKIRDDKNYWHQVESYVARHSEARFSHGICPACYEQVAKPELDRIRAPQPAAR
jgi:DNA-binding response OmpR family regulator